MARPSPSTNSRRPRQCLSLPTPTGNQTTKTQSKRCRGRTRAERQSLRRLVLQRKVVVFVRARNDPSPPSPPGVLRDPPQQAGRGEEESCLTLRCNANIEYRISPLAVHTIDIIGNNPQISPITQIREFSKEKSAKICNLWINKTKILITDKA